MDLGKKAFILPILQFLLTVHREQKGRRKVIATALERKLSLSLKEEEEHGF